MDKFKYDGTPLSDLLSSTWTDTATDIDTGNVSWNDFTQQGQVSNYIGVNNSGNHNYITAGDIGYSQQGTPVAGVSTHNIHVSTKNDLSVVGYNKISGAFVGGGGGGGGGAGGVAEANGSDGGAGGKAEIVTFTTNISAENVIKIQIGNLGAGGGSGQGNNEGASEGGGNGGWGNASYIKKSDDSILVTALGGPGGTGGQGQNQPETGSPHKTPAAGQPATQDGITGTAIDIINYGRGGNLGSGGGHSARGQGGNGGESGYALIFLQKN